MSGSVGQAVERWHDFYVMAGGVAATLLGLLFTTMALRSGQADADLGVEHDLWAAASVPFACFLDILLFSLTFLVPGQSALGLGLPMLGLAVLAIALLWWVAARRWSLPALRWRWRLLTVLPCYLAQTVVALSVLGGRTGLLWLVAVTVGGLILNAAVAAWELLREPILAQAERSSAPRAGGRVPRGGADRG
jgi:hypothetical protein